MLLKNTFLSADWYNSPLCKHISCPRQNPFLSNNNKCQGDDGFCVGYPSASMAFVRISFVLRLVLEN